MASTTTTMASDLAPPPRLHPASPLPTSPDQVTSSLSLSISAGFAGLMILAYAIASCCINNASKASSDYDTQLEMDDDDI